MIIKITQRRDTRPLEVNTEWVVQLQNTWASTKYSVKDGYDKFSNPENKLKEKVNNTSNPEIDGRKTQFKTMCIVYYAIHSIISFRKYNN